MAEQDDVNKDVHSSDVVNTPVAEPQSEAMNTNALPNESIPDLGDAEKQINVHDHYKSVLAEEDYSVFTTNQKRMIMVIGSLTAWLSPMTGSIYYPALNSIAASLHVTSAQVNLTVTTYLIVQGLAPMRIFWFLLILSCVFFVVIALFLPETCRKLVGDGSVPPPWTCVNVTDTRRHKKRAQNGHVVNEEKKAELRKNFKLTFPNPLGTLLVLADLESALILIATGLAISCFYAISTGASTAFRDLYGFDDLYVSLMFLPIGMGGVVSVFTTGKLIDWNYRRHAKRLDFPIVKNRQTDLSNFPIEAARLQIALPVFLLGVGSIIGYGWMMTHKISLAGPIVMLFILGYSLIAASQTLNVLIIDIYPGQPATATAANNVCRCLLGAAATAAIGPMSNAMGNGWAYTTLALLFFASCAGPLATMKYGLGWRQARKSKEDMAEKQRESRKAEKSAMTGE